MPLPPADADMNETPSFQFSHAECLLYTLHTLGKQAPDLLTFPEDAAKLKDFRSRLQYLARGTQGYVRKSNLILSYLTFYNPNTQMLACFVRKSI